MKAIVLKGIKQPLVQKEAEKPVAAAGEVIVKIKAAAFNHRDWWIQQGQYAGLKFPIILGSDGSGIVDSVSDDADRDWLGKEVVIYPGLHWGEEERFPSNRYQVLGLPDNGTWAEYVKVPVENIFLKPGYLSFEEAAAIPVAGLTAFRALFVKGGWKPGYRVLISGAGGGAAVFALQYAVAAGAETYVTSGSDAKIEKALSLGAKGGINYHEDNWPEKLQARYGQFDVIVDSALGKGFPYLIDLAAKGGTISFFGETAGAIPEMNGRKIFGKQLTLCGTSLGSPRDFASLLSFCEQHHIHPVIDTVYSFSEAEKAMRAMDKGNTKYGKLIMTIS